MGHDLAVHVRLADAPGDQLGVLRPEVDDQNGALRLGGMQRQRRQCPMPMPCDRCSVLPSVCKAGATITSAFWNSLTDS